MDEAKGPNPYFEGNFDEETADLRNLRLSLVQERDELRRQVHNLNWALSMPGFEQMATPEDQAEHEAGAAAVDSVLARMEHNKAQHDAMVMDAERYRWLLSRLKAYDMDGPALLFSWPAGVAFNFGAPTDSIDAAMAGQAELVLHNV